MRYEVSWDRDVTIKHVNSDNIKYAYVLSYNSHDLHQGPFKVGSRLHALSYKQALDKATELWFSQRGRSLSGSVQTQSPNHQSERRDSDARYKQGPPPRRARISTSGRACWYCWEVERNK